MLPFFLAAPWIRHGIYFAIACSFYRFKWRFFPKIPSPQPGVTGIPGARRCSPPDRPDRGRSPPRDADAQVHERMQMADGMEFREKHDIKK